MGRPVLGLLWPAASGPVLFSGDSRARFAFRPDTSYLCAMSVELMRKRLAADRASFIEPCLPSPADKPPSGSSWIHEIKHDGYRMMAQRDPVASG